MTVSRELITELHLTVSLRDSSVHQVWAPPVGTFGGLVGSQAESGVVRRRQVGSGGAVTLGFTMSSAWTWEHARVLNSWYVFLDELWRKCSSTPSVRNEMKSSEQEMMSHRCCWCVCCFDGTSGRRRRMLRKFHQSRSFFFWIDKSGLYWSECVKLGADYFYLQVYNFLWSSLVCKLLLNVRENRNSPRFEHKKQAFIRLLADTVFFGWICYFIVY